jgi:hypothetical protein
MLDQQSLEEWNLYATDRLRRYEENEKDPLIEIKDILRQSTSGQYIWELLQNAEDAHAEQVSIRLTKDYLFFQHNGSLKFSLKDAKAISKVGFSGKTDQPSIGQFGVGFKSVFKYAQSVEIYAGNLRFALENYTKIVNNIPTINQETDNDQLTSFKIIFKKELQTSAVEDSLEVLNNFNDESLLFLKHLKQITIDAEKLQGQIQKEDIGKSKLRITTTKDEEIETTYWYQRTQSVVTEIKDGNAETKSLRETYLGYAIKMVESEGQYKFQQADKAKVFTYFPLPDQTSNLKFHIHAPFVIDLNRSMLDTNPKNMAENNRLIKLVSTLLASDILLMHSAKEMDDSLLTVLPISTDSLPPYLNPISQSILEIFQNNKMVKIADGMYSNPEEVFQASPEIIKLIGIQGLALYNQVTNSELRRINPGKSVKGKYFLPKSAEARISSFLRHIGVALIDDKKVFDFFKELNFQFGRPGNLDLVQLQKSLFVWLEAKSDIEIRQMYSMLGKVEIPRNNILNLPIFRTLAVVGHDYLKVNDVYLPTTLDQNEIDVIKSSIYFKDLVESEKLQDLQTFFENIGVKEKDEWVVLEHFVAKERHPDSREKEKMRIPYFINFYNKDKNRFLNITRNRVYFIGEQFDSENRFWLDPNDIFRATSEFNVHKLNSLAEETEREYVLWSEYDLTPEFENMVRELGVNTNLRISKNTNLRISGSSGTITFLQTILNSKDLSLIIILWKFLRNLDYSDLRIRLGKKEFDTELLRQLRETPWIPTLDGSFVTPYNCDPEKLPDAFRDYSGVFFSVSDFGGKIRDTAITNERTIALAKEAGFDSPEQMAMALALVKQYKPEDLAKMLKTNQMPEYSKIPNREDEVIAAKKEERNNPEIEYSNEIKTTRATYEEGQQKRKDQLKEIYGSTSGDISCQMCHQKQMPFKTPRGIDGIEWDYFEGVMLFTKYKKESSVNALALCPNCSAKVKNFRNHSRGLSDNEIKKEIIRLKNDLDYINLNNSEIFFEFEILGASYAMKFNKKHLLALYGLLEVSQEK